jgi:iron complex outermembrane receptor protein
VAVTPTSPLMNQADNIFNPLRFHMRDSIEWRLGNLDSIVFINYENAYNNTTVTPVQRISALTTVDLHLSYNLGERYPQSWLKGVTVSLDVQNLFDSDPPFVNIAENANGGGGYDPTVTNPIGRLYPRQAILTHGSAAQSWPAAFSGWPGHYRFRRPVLPSCRRPIAGLWCGTA